MKDIIKRKNIENKIFEIRSRKVIIDSDLAELYGAKNYRLNEQVSRNSGKFPKNFMFRLTKDEVREVIAKCDHLSDILVSYREYLQSMEF